MVDNDLRRDLALLGIDVSSNDFLVFQALLQAAGGEGRPVTYNMIVPVLEALSERTFTKAYVYRCLNNLEQQGLIIVDSIHHPRQYSVSEGGLRVAVRKMKEKKREVLISEKNELTNKLSLLRNASPMDVALTLTASLEGPMSSSNSIMIEGVENVRTVVIREFAEAAQAGDIVRVLAYMSTIAEGLGPGGTPELRLMQSASKGAKVVGVLIPSAPLDIEVRRMADYMQNIGMVFKQMSSTGNIGLKLAAAPTRTYRMVSLNDEKMLLYFTHAKESDVAALIQRKDNPGLIDDAISTFDSLWETGKDVLERVSAELR